MTATVETVEKKNRSDPFVNFYITGRPGRRGAGRRQTDNIKPPAGKRDSNLTKGRDIDLCQAQQSKNERTTKKSVLSRRYRTEE